MIRVKKAAMGWKIRIEERVVRVPTGRVKSPLLSAPTTTATRKSVQLRQVEQRNKVPRWNGCHRIRTRIVSNLEVTARIALAISKDAKINAVELGERYRLDDWDGQDGYQEQDESRQQQYGQWRRRAQHVEDATCLSR